MIQCKNINQAQIYPIINSTRAMLELSSVQFANLLYSESNVELVRETVIPKLLT